MILLIGLNKAQVLAELYNAAKPLGMDCFYYDPAPMTQEEAEKLLKQTTDFYRVRGRVLSVNLSGDELDPRCYDRENGQGAAAAVIDKITRGK